jgi:glutathione S-transferase
MSSTYVLYGWHLSYFSGKMRCYLQHKKIPFADTPVDFWTLTRRIKRRFGIPVMPVVVSASGEWLQDTSAIIDRLETEFPDRSVIPASPVQRFAAYLLETWGDEWWVPIAMHTRWSYPENYPLFERDAGKALLPRFPGFIQRAAVARIAKLLRSYLPRVGVFAEQFAIMDGWTDRTLDQLDAHFASNAYLLGSRPTIGDFGLIGPMYAHLGRDPWPRRELIDLRPHLRAWIDRMAQMPPPEIGDLPQDDSLPASLAPALRLIIDEFLPMAEAINVEMVEALRATSGQQLLPRGLGMISHPMGNGHFQRTALPFVVWKIQRLLDVYAAMTPTEQSAVRSWLKTLGGERLLDMKIPRLRRVGVLVGLSEEKAA